MSSYVFFGVWRKVSWISPIIFATIIARRQSTIKLSSDRKICQQSMKNIFSPKRFFFHLAHSPLISLCVRSTHRSRLRFSFSHIKRRAVDERRGNNKKERQKKNWEENSSLCHRSTKKKSNFNTIFFSNKFHVGGWQGSASKRALVWKVEMDRGVKPSKCHCNSSHFSTHCPLQSLVDYLSHLWFCSYIFSISQFQPTRSTVTPIHCRPSHFDAWFISSFHHSIRRKSTRSTSAVGVKNSRNCVTWSSH